MQIHRVDSRHRRDYIDLPWRIYRNDSSWVPPLRSDARSLMDPKKNPFFRHALVEHFVAVLPDGEVVGRIAACIHPFEDNRPATESCSFGFFESVQDFDVARSLLGAVESWARARKMRFVHGPYNYCGTQELGLLTDGFHSRPAYFQTYNPPYYPKLVENAGYSVKYRMTTWECGREVLVRSKRFLEAGERVGASAGITVRPIDIRHFDRDMEIVRQLFNESFAGQEGIVPFEHDVLHAQVGALKPLLKHKLSLLVEKDGKAVAFAVVIPDVNELLIQVNGKLGIWQMLTIGRRIAAIRAAVVIVIGAIPETHGSGLGRVIAAGIARALEAGGYERLHTTWIHESNTGSRALVRRLGFRQNREYSIFQRAL